MRLTALVAAAAMLLGGCSTTVDGGADSSGGAGGSAPSAGLPDGDAGERLDAVLAGLRRGSDAVTTFQVVEVPKDPGAVDTETSMIRRVEGGYEYHKLTERTPAPGAAAPSRAGSRSDERPDEEIVVDGQVYARSKAAELELGAPQGVWFRATTDSSSAVLSALATLVASKETDPLSEFSTDLTDLANITTAVDELAPRQLDGATVRGYRLSYQDGFVKQPTEFWVDDQWRLVRARGGTLGDSERRFSKFNQPVEIKAPAASEVYQVK
ncbi:hypothetical protein [Nakamurella aerolata]|uniref:Lipoprotein LprG n=1 Tax=Nakamurella aerolata TaxID=1656892 RepID=A0A849A6M7_9ACTN|nr:hypothetical protein [Nakamurella aerolata]NNG34671.1 hypothetical protein [Nakamurella aerolata]